MTPFTKYSKQKAPAGRLKVLLTDNIWHWDRISNFSWFCHQNVICFCKSCFWKRFVQYFLDLKNSKYCTHVCNILNLSDLKRFQIKHSKTRNTIKNLHATFDSQLPIVLGFLPPEGAPGSYKAHILHARIYGHAEFDFDTPEASNWLKWYVFDDFHFYIFSYFS